MEKKVIKVGETPSAKKIAEKLTAISPVKGMKNPDGSEVSEETIKIVEQLSKTVETEDDPMSTEGFMESLRKVQETSGTPESQKVLDRLIALQRAKQEGRLEEHLADMAKHQQAQHDRTALTKKQKRAIHDFMANTIKCDEYIVISMKEYELGLQTEVLTQLSTDLVEEILIELVKSIRNDKSIRGQETVKD